MNNNDGEVTVGDVATGRCDDMVAVCWFWPVTGSAAERAFHALPSAQGSQRKPVHQV